MKQHKISQFFRRHSCARSLTAAAALVTAILALPAKAEIVYKSANITITGNGSLPIDLNHDGITDFTIVSYYRRILCAGTGPGHSELLQVALAYSNGVVAGSNFALALGSGVRISSSQPFYYGEALMAQASSCIWPPHENWGAWLGPVYNHYLGFKFEIKGHTHYGWARLTVLGPVVTLTGYAYETVSGQAITTGKTTGP